MQEALTNAMRHAGPAHVCLRVACDGRDVALVVEARDGAEPDRHQRRSGHGLPGMRERVRGHGGSFAGRRGGDGRVHARLPIEDGAPLTEPGNGGPGP